MEDNLFDKIRESEELYGHVEMPNKALQDYRAYASSQTVPNDKTYKRILLGLIATLLLTNGFWLVKLFNNQNSSAISMTTNTEVIKDTIYITKEVYASDLNDFRNTNDNEIEVLKTELKNQIFNFNQRRSTYLNEINDLKSLIKSSRELGSSQVLSLDRNASIKIPLSTIEKKSNSSLEDRTVLNPINTLQNLDVSYLEYKKSRVSIPLPPIIIQLNKKLSIGEFLKPKSFSLAATTGIVQQTSNKYSALSGTQWGFGFTSLMTKHWRYNLSFDYFKLNGEYEDEDVLPNIESPSAPAGSTLEEVYVSQSGRQGSIGVDYLFSPIKFIRPYAGLYYQNRSSNFNDIKFKFKRDGSEEIELSSPNTASLNQNIIGIRSGIDINLWKSIDAFIGINYNYNLSTLENSLLSLNTGMYYHF